jgi:hypothetical protein
MKRDIEIPEVQNVTIAIACEKNILNQDQWAVHLINNNDFPLENTLVASKGYGEKEGETQRTSTCVISWKRYLQIVQRWLNQSIHRFFISRMSIG